MNGVKKWSTDHSCWVLTMCVWDRHTDAHSCHYHIRLLKVRNSNFLKKFFIYFWWCWVFIAACGLSLVATSEDYPLVWCMGFSLLRLLSMQSLASIEFRFQWLWYPGLGCGTLQPVESSLKRGGIHILVLAGRFLTAGLPGKSRDCNFKGVLLDSDSDKNTKTWLQLWF